MEQQPESIRHDFSLLKAIRAKQNLGNETKRTAWITGCEAIRILF